MGMAAPLWRTIWASSPDDWAAWQAYLRCALAACRQSAATDGLDEREGGAAVGRGDAGTCSAAQARTLAYAIFCIVYAMADLCRRERSVQAMCCCVSQARVLDEAQEALLAASSPPHRPANGCQQPRGLPPVRLRGLALAAVDLAARRLRGRLHRQQSGRGSSQGLAESIATYFTSFGDSASCATDLRHAASIVWMKA